MAHFILAFIASYIIGIIGWGIVCYIDPDVTTYKDLIENLESTPAYVPIVNVVTFLVFLALACVACVSTLFYKYCGIKKLCNKIKNKKLPFKK